MTTTELGFFAMKRGDHQEAVNIFKRALEKGKRADAFFGLGLAHYHLGDLPTARWAFHKALELNRDNREATDYLGRIEAAKQPRPAAARGSAFRALRDHLEVHDGEWKKFFVKGVNIGVGLPGYFPGEFAVKKRTYQQWFTQIAELGANAVRVYTILPPEFYEALFLFNAAGRRLYLFQEVWTELPEKNDFRDRRFLDGFQSEIRNTVDAVYGNAVLPERPGHAHGRYDCDVSPYVAGFILGREWEACSVKAFNELHGRQVRDHRGTFLSVQNGTPFEVWITEMCDFLQRYEQERYRLTHPVTTVNWPTLDPLDHPSESTYGDASAAPTAGPQNDQASCERVPIEDAESLDLTKIRSHSGSGFFALYHVYPYYPDFMNNDYADRENAYLAYLTALKSHHGRQPVLIAEFGVPSSREAAHWHRGGWHQGRHSDRDQGEINGLLMQAIHRSGMAGGILFSWSDEWFKKNWLFQPYEVPAERKPFWFNIQDPEQNYGLLAAYPGYPGKKVNLACRSEDWAGAAALYEKQKDTMAFRFPDGADDARRLKRLSVQHDEGFLYLLLETAGAIDFTRANYLIGLDTCSSGAGERLIPFGTNVPSPVGLAFLIHLAGKERSRILTTASYDKYLNSAIGVITPGESDQGAWVMMQNEPNVRRSSRDGKRIFPARHFSMSRLTFGTLDRKSPDYHSLADFYYRDRAIELRIPWGLINITDPSSQRVLWKDRNGTTRKTKGIQVLAISYKPDDGGVTAHPTGRPQNHTDGLPAGLTASAVRTYSWEGWETPLYHTFLKESYFRYKKILKRIPEGR
jgi:tetratricopeptide (TPR) repeat protein